MCTDHKGANGSKTFHINRIDRNSKASATASNSEDVSKRRDIGNNRDNFIRDVSNSGDTSKSSCLDSSLLDCSPAVQEFVGSNRGR
jgi:hypothetical protein